ncbi:hypothetical protein GALMADRAFT_206593 [Galerina marginata CBS 339.88]|uniref:Chromatin modification-related protein EAF7 n=1 Tax=Galerina marginata (strain CBS 339.88) TaxID=685588 RepID=A0A067THY4_GALM3|nr:hypothetical protein GALMADRAFT_206593 [Galerina marginata CBS 339.88]
MTVAMPGDRTDEHSFLDSVEGEISFFRSIMRARPIGMHRYFHILAIRNTIFKDTGRNLHIETIWEKLRDCYDLDALDAIDIEAEGYHSPRSNSSPISIRSPSPSENLAAHPFFREEFSLPYEEFEPIIAQRRMRATASLPSSRAPSPAPAQTPAAAPSPRIISSTSSTKRGTGRKRGKNARSKPNYAGLVGGDSDSSALTQESGDEGGLPETPRDSVMTGTDGGTEYEDDDVEMHDPSPAQEASPRPPRGRPPKAGRSRGRGGSTRGGSTRGIKRKKK